MSSKPRSATSFEISIPPTRPKTSAPSSARGPNSKSGSEAPHEVSKEGEEDDELAIKASTSAKAPGLFKIHSRQLNEGLEPAYIVQLVEDGKKVRRDESEVRRLAPTLLAAFLADQAPSKTNSKAAEAETIILDSDDSISDADVVVRKPKREVVEKNAKKEKEKKETRGKKSGDGEDEEMDEESNPEPELGDPSDSEGEEESSDDDGDDSEEANFTDNEKAKPRKTARSTKAGRNMKPKSPKKATRISSRANKFQKTFDLGGGKQEDGDDEEGEEEEEEEKEKSGKSRRGTRSRPSISDAESSDEEALSKSARGKKSKAKAKEITIESDEEDEEAGQGDLVQHTHYDTCGKCGEGPASQVLPALLKKRQRSKGKKRRGADDDLREDSDAEESRVRKLGAWMECAVCTSSFHFGCLPDAIRKEFVKGLKAEHEALHAPPPPPVVEPIEGQAAPDPVSPPPKVDLPKREKIELDIETSFIIPKCTYCKRVGGRRCFVCGVSGRKITAVASEKMEVDVDVESEQPVAEIPPLMLRCVKCKRSAHYPCLPLEEAEDGEDENEERTVSPEEHAASYLRDEQCHQCWSYKGKLDVILAWAEDEMLSEQRSKSVDDDADDVRVDVEVVVKKDDKTGKMVSIPSAKDPTANAQYLVKWQGESYRQLEWIPHAYLVAAYPAKLSNFLSKGSQVTFDAKMEDEAEDGEEDKVVLGSAPLPDPDATSRIPAAWSTVDRILDVFYRSKNGKDTIRYQDYKKLPSDPEESIELVEECYFKWGELPYSSCEFSRFVPFGNLADLRFPATTEAPPQKDEEGYAAYVKAYKRFLIACDAKMRVPNLSSKQLQELDKTRDPKKFVEIKEQPDYIEGGKLMPFQLEGVNFLFFQWWKRTGCILADEMGLGKTVQIITFLTLLNKKQGARPFLVAVPNSTMGNWVREFERWAPGMRVVPYGGDAASRKIVEEYELFDSSGRTLKTHVVIATYEALEKNISVFKKVARWDCLVVDEGQRLKSGHDGLLFSALQTLNVNHRVLLSGTPLNNNISELFNLLHFIDPEKWGNQKELQEKYAELTPELVEEIRNILKPYFLRRTKELVLDLPPLNEIVVPVTMTPLQRSLYKGILERNAAAIESIYQKASKGAEKSKGRKASFNNILMELRKLLGHPYLVSPDLEPLDVTKAQAHANLRDASAKFVLLSKMLPKLKAGGHRVLIFSQFKITLNIVEDFLLGLNMKYLRLDGDTAQLDRQRGIDAFQKEGSEFFCYLLSTRAGGVGINLTKADTVIMFDQDFNPHQDIQAISRAHRIGQKNPVRVFKLMVKGTCEERIFQAGTKKLGLDHLIIQRLNAEETEANEIESILQFGAKAIFDDQEAEATAIRYSDADMDNLFARTADISASSKKDGAAAFSHAKIWEAERGLEDVVIRPEDEMVEDDGDFWNSLLVQQDEADRLAKLEREANAGRGKRTRGQVDYKVDDNVVMKKQKGSSAPISESSDDDFEVVEAEESGDDFDMVLDKDDLPPVEKEPKPKKTKGLVRWPVNEAEKAARRIDMIDSLARAAAAFQDAEVNAILASARMAPRQRQSVLIREASKPYSLFLFSLRTSSEQARLRPLFAAKLIDALCGQEYTGPLGNNAAATNGGVVPAGQVAAKKAPTSTSP
ncbi:hypothetical protein P7C70_g2963, partial [Phenoliferia sp. Uapishka_3]